MDHRSWLSPADLTPSGRPVLLPTETELSLLPSVDLEPPLPSLPASSLLVLTSHRLLLLSPPSARAIPLSSLVHAFPPKKSIRGMFSSPRIRLQVSGSEVVTLVLRGKADPDAFFALLWDALRARAWEAAPAQPWM